MSTPDTRAAYSEYLLSDHWKRLKIDARFRHGDRCIVCRKTPVDFHHLTYHNPWTECTADDVVPLCRECHRILHSNLRAIQLLASAITNNERRRILKIAEPVFYPGRREPAPTYPPNLLKRARRRLRKLNHQTHHNKKLRKPWREMSLQERWMAKREPDNRPWHPWGGHMQEPRRHMVRY